MRGDSDVSRKLDLGVSMQHSLVDDTIAIHVDTCTRDTNTPYARIYTCAVKCKKAGDKIINIKLSEIIRQTISIAYYTVIKQIQYLGCRVSVSYSGL